MAILISIAPKKAYDGPIIYEKTDIRFSNVS